MSLQQSIVEVQRRMGESIIGQQTVIERLMIALLANGNVLMEGSARHGQDALDQDACPS